MLLMMFLMPIRNPKFRNQLLLTVRCPLRASTLGAKLDRIRGLSPSQQPHWAGIRPN
jgi:hypothetical protein